MPVVDLYNSIPSAASIFVTLYPTPHESISPPCSVIVNAGILNFKLFELLFELLFKLLLALLLVDFSFSHFAFKIKFFITGVSKLYASSSKYQPMNVYPSLTGFSGILTFSFFSTT